MKKTLLLMMCCPMILSAQNGVTVSNLNVNAGTVTFNVSWNDNQPEDFLWSDSVWVFVDYNKNGVMTRLPVTSATATAGTVTKIQGNDKGAWVIGNAHSAGNFSAMVKLHTAITDLHGVCAYASNYPPVGEYVDATQIKFTGTPPYNLVLVSAGSVTRTYSINDNYFKLYDGEILQSFTDKTGAPGTLLAPLSIQAASPNTWTYGSLTWSDYIVASPPSCSTTLSASSMSGTLPQLYVQDDHYYYTATCVHTAGTFLCPDPWRVPTHAELRTYGAPSNAAAVAANWPKYGLIGTNPALIEVGKTSHVWSSTISDGNYCYCSSYAGFDCICRQYIAMNVICVRDAN
jgi:hypothetical protein